MFEFSVSGLELEFMLNLIIAVFAGFLLGSERKSKGKAAGVGTFTTVIAGSMLFAFMSTHVDPMSTSRIAAQIVTGIGFIGAGMIFLQKEEKRIRNLTTAASVWYAGAIGMALGFGYHLIAVISAVAAVIIVRLPNLKKIEKKGLTE
jgi:putative Mg2+ transporter-C (MgtC) family protein